MDNFAIFFGAATVNNIYVIVIKEINISGMEGA
jgi:hypothetical protein